MLDRKHVEWSKNAILYEVNLRQYSQGGTIDEFISHIPRLKNLGVTILWFMPIQPIGVKKRKGRLGSYYSIKNYTEIDPSYGTSDDFRELVNTAHKAGMKVILDWVANHTAWDHHWAETKPEYYVKDEHGNIKAPFPEWADVADLDYNNVELRKEMCNEMRFWVREYDIDGFRCDMAHLVPTSFWDETRAELEKEKHLFMLAESENRDLLNYAFDTIYNWNIFHCLNRIAKGENSVIDLDNMFFHEITNFPEHAFQLFFTSNHDENSWNGSAIERLGYSLELMNVFIFTIHGMPLIYSGQEAGLARKLSFFDKDCIEWKDDKMAAFYQVLTKLKKRNKAIWTGEFGGITQRVNTDKNYHIFAYLRQKENHKIFVILNMSYEHHYFTLSGNDYIGEYNEIFTNETNYFVHNSTFSLPPWGYRVFEQHK